MVWGLVWPLSHPSRTQARSSRSLQPLSQLALDGLHLLVFTLHRLPGLVCVALALVKCGRLWTRQKGWHRF